MRNELVSTITNKVLELVIVEISRDDMKETIKAKVIHPLLYMVYCQLYPYIFTILIIIILMFLILLTLLVVFIVYLKKN
jgi:hypothetical protein